MGNPARRAAGDPAAAGDAAGGARHHDGRGTDLHDEGRAGQTAGGAGRHQGPTEGDQQPPDCTAGLNSQPALREALQEECREKRNLKRNTAAPSSVKLMPRLI